MDEFRSLLSGHVFSIDIMSNCLCCLIMLLNASDLEIVKPHIKRRVEKAGRQWKVLKVSYDTYTLSNVPRHCQGSKLPRKGPRTIVDGRGRALRSPNGVNRARCN